MQQYKAAALKAMNISVMHLNIHTVYSIPKASEKISLNITPKGKKPNKRQEVGSPLIWGNCEEGPMLSAC